MLTKISGVVVATVATAGSAYAAVPAAVETAIGTAGTDMTTVAGLVFVAVIGLLAFSLMRKAAH